MLRAPFAEWSQYHVQVSDSNPLMAQMADDFRITRREPERKEDRHSIPHWERGVRLQNAPPFQFRKLRMDQRAKGPCPPKEPDDPQRRRTAASCSFGAANL